MDSLVSTPNLQEAGYLTNDSLSENNCAIAVVNNCKKAFVFQVTEITKPDRTNALLYHNTGGACLPGNSSDQLGDSFDNQKFLINKINTISYFVRFNSEKLQQRSLYRRVGLNDPEELVSEIENMQVSYGLDTDIPFNGANYYTTADKVTYTDWPKVVSIRISLLAVTLEDNLTPQPMPYTFNGITTTTTSTPPVTDHKIRRVFTTTIAIRNRLP
jgi:type IV pilus assembly protein PilW